MNSADIRTDGSADPGMGHDDDILQLERLYELWKQHEQSIMPFLSANDGVGIPNVLLRYALTSEVARSSLLQIGEFAVMVDGNLGVLCDGISSSVLSPQQFSVLVAIKQLHRDGMFVESAQESREPHDAVMDAIDQATPKSTVSERGLEREPREVLAFKHVHQLAEKQHIEVTTLATQVQITTPAAPVVQSASIASESVRSDASHADYKSDSAGRPWLNCDHLGGWNGGLSA